MAKARFCWFFLLVLTVPALLAMAQSPAPRQPAAAPAVPRAEKTPYVSVRLLPERTHVRGGEEIWIGIEQSIHPGWHTYWKNPGDSGSQPRINWTLPDGFKTREIAWPMPKKLPYGDLLNYGYENNAILLQKLRIPSSLPPGRIVLKAETEILVCKDICIPEFATHDLVLNDPAAPEIDNSAYLDAAKNKLPVVSGMPASLARKEGFAELRLSSTAWCEPTGCRDLTLFPADWGIVQSTADAATEMEDGVLVIRQKATEDRDWFTLKKPSFIIGYTDRSGQYHGIEIQADVVSGLFETPYAAGEDVQEGSFLRAVGDFLKYAGLAILGGIVLNLMPCVFPVLSIKALGLVKTADEAPALARRHGLAYTAGVVLSFLLVAAILIAFQAAGSRIGWGFQLQNPVFVTLLVYLMFLIGLNLIGFFEIGGGFMNWGQRLTRHSGLTGSFFTGVLATVVATPCTAPFMAAALGFALTQPPLASLAIFAALGFGLALPYLALSVLPGFARILPKPGPWMVVFKQFLAFPMFLTCAWLLWVLSQQAGSMGVFGALLGLVGLGFGIWLIRVAPQGRGVVRGFVLTLAGLSMLGALGFLPVQSKSKQQNPATAAGTTEAAFGTAFSQSKLDALLQGNKPVFVEMTAAWCITCKVNHATSLNIDSTKALFAERGIEYLIGDWTNYDPAITQYLESFKRNGVPIYVFYGPRDPETGTRPDPVVLPQILTPGIVAAAVGGKPS